MAEEPQASTSWMSDHASNFVCGAGAALMETTLVYPLNKTSFRQQLHGISIRGALAQISSEGLAKLYRGILPPLLQKTASRALMFGMYEELSTAFACPSDGFSACHAQAAFLAGATEAVLAPLERVQVLLQSTRFHDRLQNTPHAFALLWREHGLREFYRGLTPILIRNGTSNVLFFGARGPIRDWVLSQHAGLGWSPELRSFTADFISGAVLGACLSTAFFPINVVKVRMQSELGGPFSSLAAVMRLIWAERNRSLKELYLGGRLNYTRSLLSWGITNSVFGLLQRHFFHKPLSSHAG